MNGRAMWLADMSLGWFRVHIVKIIVLTDYRGINHTCRIRVAVSEVEVALVGFAGGPTRFACEALLRVVLSAP